MGRLVAGVPVPLPLWRFDPDDPRAYSGGVGEADEAKRAIRAELERLRRQR